jgi:hypothetical protein
MTARGIKKEESNLKTPTTSRDIIKPASGTTSGLKRPTTAAVSSNMASASASKKTSLKGSMIESSTLN